MKIYQKNLRRIPIYDTEQVKGRLLWLKAGGGDIRCSASPCHLALSPPWQFNSGRVLGNLGLPRRRLASQGVDAFWPPSSLCHRGQGQAPENPLCPPATPQGTSRWAGQGARACGGESACVWGCEGERRVREKAHGSRTCRGWMPLARR